MLSAVLAITVDTMSPTCDGEAINFSFSKLDGPCPTLICSVAISTTPLPYLVSDGLKDISRHYELAGRSRYISGSSSAWVFPREGLDRGLSPQALSSLVLCLKAGAVTNSLSPLDLCQTSCAIDKHSALRVSSPRLGIPSKCSLAPSPDHTQSLS